MNLRFQNHYKTSEIYSSLEGNGFSILIVGRQSQELERSLTPKKGQCKKQNKKNMRKLFLIKQNS